MVEKQFDIVGIGNAIVDILYHSDDQFLTEQSIVKGSMTIIDDEQAEKIYLQMEKGVEASGGSAANTIACFSSLGGSGAFIGKVCDDKLGRTFTSDINRAGVFFDTAPDKKCAPTARCFVFVTPDAERTMLTYLGASTELGVYDVDETLIVNSQLLYLEGYLFDPPKAKEAFVRAAKAAKKSGCRVSLSLSDIFCVDRHRLDFISFINDYVDILFANEDEIKSLHNANTFEDALKKTREHVELAALTRGAQGSVVVNSEITLAINPTTTKRIVDTTGAGDSYAAGFLYGLAKGNNLEECGHFGSILASEIIADFGARPKNDLRKILEKTK